MSRIESAQGWIGVFFMAYPIIRLIATAVGVELPDLGLGGVSDSFAVASAATGTALLARSKPIV